MIENSDMWIRRFEESLETKVCKDCILVNRCAILPNIHCKAFEKLEAIELFELLKAKKGKDEPKKPQSTNFVKWLFLSAWKVLKWIVKKWKDHIRGKEK
jgi:hypothetical protein